MWSVILNKVNFLFNFQITLKVVPLWKFVDK